ncbi:MAG: SUMF1/EgtB/PvdO family nonheme iron enzyme [Spirochaetaceae bacterium]|jgi:hypothetical protein|nr:SUMF1/EgtB/PvdO family nonheme iron enzyme [Spirochaetaceae bacterium]
MFGKARKGVESSARDLVELKPVMGIRPGVYLTLLYALILVLVLFFVLLFPGLRNPGSIVSIDSEPEGAAVRIDGIYQGAAPLSVFVPKGEHRVSLVLPAFNLKEFEVNVGGRVFASLLFPKRMSFSEKLDNPDPLAVLSFGASDYARWASVGEPSAIYQIPLSLSEGAYRAGRAAEGQYRDMVGILTASARFARSRAQIRDLIRAKFLIDTGGLVSPLSLVNSSRDMLEYLSDNPGTSFWLSEAAYGGGLNTVSVSPWHQGHTTAGERPEGGGVAGGSMTLRGIEFRSIPAGSLNRALPYAEETAVPSFWMAASELGREDWNRFVSENPRWAGDNRSALSAEGLITGDYLLPPPGAMPGDQGGEQGTAITGVSWYAARAYCAWLDASLAMPGYTVRLPTELEWEYAAAVNRRTASRPLDMLLNHWEWCENPYSYLDYLPQGAMERIDAPERPVRGGSWLNTSGTINGETRGALDPETCSPFVSFRPVIAPAGSRGGR